MKNFIKIIMILLSLCVIAGTIATGLSVLNYAGLLDAGTGDPLKRLQPVMMYGSVTMAFIALGLWMLNVIKNR